MAHSYHCNFISIAKAISIILVVVWHARPSLPIGIWIMFFAVPLFFFTSGWFFKGISNRIDFKNYFLKRVKGLYFPYIKWGILFLLLHNLFFIFHIYDIGSLYNGKAIEPYSISDSFKHLVLMVGTMNGHDRLLGAFWFMKCLFLSSISVAIVYWVIGKVKWHIPSAVVVVLFMGGTFMSSLFSISFPIIGGLDRVFMGGGFIVSGKMVAENEKLLSWGWGLLGCSFCISLLGLFIYDWVISIVHFGPMDVLPYYVLAIAGITFIITFSKLVERIYLIATPLYVVGNHTLTILALHFLSFKIINLAKIAYYDLPIERLADFPIILKPHNALWIFLYVTCGIALPILSAFIFDYAKKEFSKI